MALKYNTTFFFRVNPTWKELLDSVSGKIKSSLLDLSGKQDVLTSITGYDATKTQILKNVSGTLTWVDETPSE